MKQLKMSVVTTLELFKFMNANSMCTFYTLKKWLATMLGTMEHFPTVNSIRQNVLHLSARLSKMKKMPSRMLLYQLF